MIILSELCMFVCVCLSLKSAYVFYLSEEIVSKQMILIRKSSNNKISIKISLSQLLGQKSLDFDINFSVGQRPEKQ